MLIDSLYRKRSWLAGMPSLIIIALSLLRASQVTPLKLPDEPKPPMKLRMVDLQPPEHVIQQPSSVTLLHTEMEDLTESIYIKARTQLVRHLWALDTIVTAIGIGVALYGLVFYNLFQERVERIGDQIKLLILQHNHGGNYA